jgi:uncharacterized membrane protein YfhO
VPDVDRPEHWHARIVVPGQGYLVQRESWYPGWRARVDGREVPIEQVDLLFRGVRLDPGEHNVDVYFASDTLFRGALFSLLGLLCLVLGTVVPIIRERGAHR